MTFSRQSILRVAIIVGAWMAFGPHAYRSARADGTECASPGLVQLSDGTFITTTDGRWTKVEQPFIDSVRFALKMLDDLSKQTTGLEEEAKQVRVLIQTEMGDIEVELDAARAPVTVANFLRYVEGKFYDGGRFHRTVKPENQPDDKVKIEVIQAGVNPNKAKEEFASIKLERTRDTKLMHKNGTISMARDGPDTATADFFLCIGDQPELDFGGKRNPDGQGFAAFGRVVKGMEVVKKIQAAPEKGQTLTPPVKILKVTRQP